MEPQDPHSKFESGNLGPLSKFKKDTHIMVLPHCFIFYIRSRNFVKEITFHKYSSCPYGPLNKVMCFKLISPGFFRKDFITVDLLYVHEEPFENV